METKVNQNFSSANDIIRKLEECKRHLYQGNLFSSIVSFREILDVYINVQDIKKSDKSRLAAAINNFQRQLAISQFFNDIYGKVFFRDDDFSTSYDFLCQLITIKEEEIADVLVNEEVARKLNLDDLGNDEQKTVKLMISLTERGESSAVRELVDTHDDLGSLILTYYNEAGINHRKNGNIDKAVIEYKKALTVSPNDENIYYNLARAYIEIGQKKNAKVTIEQALQINPDFREGLKLLKYINHWSA
jgi:tetratricopeptide (TPR) repeat protein